MRTGYLAALASRTLGVAPVLLPATPSRFEPEGPQAGLREITELRDAGPDRAAARADATALETAAEAGPSSRGIFAPDIADEPALWPRVRGGRAVPEVSETAGEPAEPAGHRQTTPLPAGAATGAVVLASAEGATRDEALAHGVPAASVVASSWHMDVVHPDAVQPGRSRQQERAARPAGESAEASGTEPPIVVRIGRVDVRAVEAARPPAAAPRPPLPAGPSLAEHLLARDRRHR